LTLIFGLKKRRVGGGRGRPGFEERLDFLRARAPQMPALARDEVQHHVPCDSEQPVAKGPFTWIGFPAVHGGSDRAEDLLDEILGVGVLKPLPAR